MNPINGPTSMNADDYVAPILAGSNPALGAGLTRFLLLMDASRRDLAVEIEANPASAYKYPIVFVERSLPATTLTAGQTLTQQLKVNGGSNAIVLGFAASAYDPAAGASVDLALIDYADIDTQAFQWIQSTSIANVAGSGVLPGLIFPQKWTGSNGHNISLTNNHSVTIVVKIAYACMIVGSVGN